MFESGGFPPGQGGAREHVTDRFGVGNRIVGEPVDPLEDSPGVGAMAGREPA